MSKRLCRSLATITVVLLTMGTSPTVAQTPEPAQRFDRGLWRITAQTFRVEAEQLQLWDVRMASPTVFVIAAHVTLTKKEILAHHATVHADSWSLPVSALSIDPRQDAVQVTPRSKAQQE